MPDNDDRMPEEAVRSVAVFVAALSAFGQQQPVDDLLVRAQRVESYIRKGLKK